MSRKLSALWFLVAIMCARVDCGCVFQGVAYPVGEVWHPEAFGTCVNCTCEINERGEPDVRCINTADKCPKLKCDSPKRDPHSCCPYCEVSDHVDESSSYKKANCTTPGGRIYRHGENYASNSTGIRPNTDNQCVMCNCQNGQPLCHLKTCLVPKSCSKFIQTEDDCCPVCADMTEVVSDVLSLYETASRKPLGDPKDQHDCMDTSGIKLNGSSWHPTIESIGEIDCITCTCLNRKIKCRKECIPDHELPCQHPKTADGKCCRSCPEEEPSTNKERKEKKRKNKKERKRRKGKGKKGKGKKRRRRCKNADKDDEKCKRRRRRKERTERTTAKTGKPTAATVGISLENLCIRKKTAYLVYRSISEKEMMIGFDDIEANTVDVFRWTVNKDNQSVNYTDVETFPSPEYRKQINNTNVVGTARKSQYKKFKRRLKDKLEKCRANCEPELFIQIMQKVKVRLLKFGDKC